VNRGPLGGWLKMRKWLFVAVIVVGVLLLAYWHLFTWTMPYQGHTIWITVTPGNFLNPIEARRVGKILRSAPVPPTVTTRDAVVKTAFGLVVPGYGISGGGSKDDPTLEFYRIEIPRANEDRVLVYRRVGGSYQLADDFVYDTDRYVIAGVRVKGNRLVYFDSDGQVVFERIGIGGEG
jgi:hypothetical protein